MIRRKDLRTWLETPTTIEFLDLLKEHRKAAYDLIAETVFNVPSVASLDLHKIAQIKGQVYTLDEILDIENFLYERVTHEEVQTIRSESDY